jgi:hypothetical protein
VTRLTPSDQADTGAAPGSAAIPSQRSARGLRLLILGTGESASALRSRAADAGAELAQRFSSRVTHVVVDETVDEDDARVVRAVAAGLPVLDPVKGGELIGGRDVIGDRGDSTGAELMPAAVKADDRGDRGALDEGEEEGVSEAAIGDVVLDEAQGVALVRPREEAETESDLDGPSSVFAGSALESVLLFPPLPADETAAVGGCGCGEDCGGGTADLSSDVTTGAEVEAGARARQASSGEESAAREWTARRGEASPLEDMAAEGIEVASVEDVADDRGQAHAPTQAVAASVLWTLVPLVSLGLLTPAAMAYAAFRLRSRTLGAATVLYAVAVVAAFTVSATAPQGGAHSGVSDLLTACFAASWLGGTVHAFMIRRRVFG